EEGATVSLTTPNGLIEGTIENGSFTAPLDPALTNGETISATLTDAANNTSDAGTARATDSTAPEAPVVDINTDGTIVTGTAEPGSRVTILDENNAIIGRAAANADTGAYEVVLETPLTNGEV
ncbi:Ig-like domain-containing protein, partial [uncultured Psychrobacter sp.]|uniref:Ig-like domain-containing protein n=1 Tax=uncultured Psychrobacter sp. TaxID=259303 RepID=UPI00263595EF